MMSPPPLPPSTHMQSVQVMSCTIGQSSSNYPPQIKTLILYMYTSHT